MKRRMPFALFVMLVFFVVLLPAVVVLINLPAITDWFSKKSPFFWGNTLVLVILIPAFVGLLLCFGVWIITKKEDQDLMAEYEREKKEHPSGNSWEKDMRNISALIEAINCSLDHIKSTSDEIVALSQTIAQINQDEDIPSMALPPPLPPLPPDKPVLSMDTFLEMPLSTEVLKIAIEKISQTEEYETFTSDTDKFKNPIPEKEVLSMLINRLIIKQDPR